MTFRLGDVAALPPALAIARRVRERGCEKKLRHGSEAEAIKHAAHLVETHRAKPDSLDTYLCQFCRFWHVGHKRG